MDDDHAIGNDPVEGIERFCLRDLVECYAVQARPWVPRNVMGDIYSRVDSQVQNDYAVATAKSAVCSINKSVRSSACL